MATAALHATIEWRDWFDERAATEMTRKGRLSSVTVRLADGARAQKPGQMVAGDADVSVDEAPRYVSRGGTKLVNALDAFGIVNLGQ